MLEDVPTGHVARGSAEARAFVEGALNLAPGARCEVVAALMSGEHFAVEWVMRPAGMRGASVGNMRAGKVVGNRDYWDASPPEK